MGVLANENKKTFFWPEPGLTDPVVLEYARSWPVTILSAGLLEHILYDYSTIGEMLPARQSLEY